MILSRENGKEILNKLKNFDMKRIEIQVNYTCNLERNYRTFKEKKRGLK